MSIHSTHVDGAEVHIEPHDEAGVTAGLAAELARHRSVRAHFGDDAVSVERVELLDKALDSSGFEAIVHHRGSCRSAHVTGRVDDLGAVVVRPSAYRPVTTQAEFNEAVEAALRDPDVRRMVEQDGLVPYRPMPPYADVQLPDGRWDRIVTVGLRSDRADLAHRIIGVRVEDGSVIHELGGVPVPTSDNCEPAAPDQACASSAGRDQVRVRVVRGGVTLWDLIVVRPKASSGTNGSGVELRYVDRLGKRVLHRAHVPILNVEYGVEGVRSGCGPTYRDWQNSEACFHADGTEPVGPGWRVCTSPPTTILESGHDGGNFRGVALWYRDGDLRIVSQLQAGWYRYISDWHLLDDGMIRPRFGFAATANPCTCKPHTHHAYWRFDFDILTAGDNIVEEFNDPPIIGNNNWHTKLYEIRRFRDAGHKRRWRVRHAGTYTGYDIVPGSNDGTADAYGVGDVWVLRYHGTELDDGHGFTTNPVYSRADLDKFVNGERVDGQDVVLWYAGHFLHDEAHPSAGGHVVGPELRPFNW